MYDLGVSLASTKRYLAREYDRQGNCVKYTYSIHAHDRYNWERSYELDSIAYTGTGNYGQRQCAVPQDGRSVSFVYADREDKRTTYQYGIGTVGADRLQSVSTFVGSQRMRVYELGYHLSSATRRSLLETVKLCSGATA